MQDVSLVINADFRGANLTQANLNGAFLRMADFSGTNLEKANLAGADFLGTNFTAVFFIKVNLTETELIGSNLYQATFSDIKELKLARNWEKAIYTEAQWDYDNKQWIPKDKAANEAKIQKIRDSDGGTVKF